jgi:hypothetical protein
MWSSGCSQLATDNLHELLYVTPSEPQTGAYMAMHTSGHEGSDGFDDVSLASSLESVEVFVP